MMDRRAHCRNDRQNHECLRRAAIEVSNQIPMVIDEKIAELDPVISEMNADSMEDVRSGNVPVEDVEEVPLSLLEEKESDGKEGELSWTDMIGIAVGQIDSEPEDAILDATSPLFCQEEEKIKGMRPENSAWYPFLNKEYLISSLLLGYLHKLISHDLYHQIRSFFTAYHIKLPRWEALREMRAKIQTLLNHTVVEKETVFGQPVFGLSARELIRDVKTIINSKKLWTETKETLDLDKLNKKSAKLAVRDQLNLKFSIQVFAFQAEKISLLAAGEELPPHMDQDIPQKLVDMEKHEPLRMHNSFMRLQVNLNKKQVLKKKYFILFNINQSTGAPLIGRINSIWMVQKPGHQSSYFFHVTVFQKLEQSEFYKMREIKKTPHKTYVQTSADVGSRPHGPRLLSGGKARKRTWSSTTAMKTDILSILACLHWCLGIKIVQPNLSGSILCTTDTWSRVTDKKETKASKKKTTISGGQMDPSLE
ncbi:hypothetical protein MJO29_013112 [Puccinia striiformis f. sp. tritici]|nr:hypothetical protein MJO29_013112 [Puccinia striiformis f. sp. tritici]